MSGNQRASCEKERVCVRLLFGLAALALVSACLSGCTRIRYFEEGSASIAVSGDGLDDGGFVRTLEFPSPDSPDVTEAHISWRGKYLGTLAVFAPLTEPVTLGCLGTFGWVRLSLTLEKDADESIGLGAIVETSFRQSPDYIVPGQYPAFELWTGDGQFDLTTESDTAGSLVMSDLSLSDWADAPCEFVPEAGFEVELTWDFGTEPTRIETEVAGPPRPGGAAIF